MAVSIARCTVDEIEDVLRFIDEHWKRGHILTTCRPLLDWQHRLRDGSGYGFMVARRQSDAAILGILGYIATDRFDPSLVDANVLWLTMWKVREDAGVSGLGIQLLQQLAATEPHAAIGAIGLTPSTLPIYKALGYLTGELHHYVHPNAHVDRFELAAIAAPPVRDVDAAMLCVRRLRTDGDFAAGSWAAGSFSSPVKTPEYFRRRYAHHPVYRYTVEAILEADAVVALMASRVAEHNGRRALRVIDFAGAPETFASLGPVIQARLDEFDAEYADVYNSGFDSDVLARAGFSCVDPDGPAIVPDHFEPFERRNVRLWYAMKGAHPVLFKGDGDQDRPNRIAGVST